MFVSRISSYLTNRQQGFQTITTLFKNARQYATISTQEKLHNETRSEPQEENKNVEITLDYRYMYPEFLPDPNPIYRHSLKERLERLDMLARRSKIHIPMFFVGSILRVIYSEPHAPGKTNEFVGICTQREGTGLRSTFTLRNVVNNEAVEIIYELYDPAIQTIDCLRLEKRLDSDLLYLRDAPLEYSTFPFDMKKETLIDEKNVPVNDIKIPINPRPWIYKYEQKNYKGILTDVASLVSPNRRRKAALNAKPWEKYDLMKKYRESIPEDEQMEIFKDLKEEITKVTSTMSKQLHKRQFVRPKKKA